MRGRVLLAALILLGASKPSIAWETSFDGAVEKCRESGKLLFIFDTAPRDGM